MQALVAENAQGRHCGNEDPADGSDDDVTDVRLDNSWGVPHVSAGEVRAIHRLLELKVNHSFVVLILAKLTKQAGFLVVKW